ncbi:hypothetical protein BASA83_011680 [Batrachochytrium salamandrivorans]|nr:hypothetical protein BASA83_011680 [Batrachochytrium salamandrivorans]
MSFESYRTTDSIARQKVPSSTSRRSSISATSFLLMDFGWIPPKSRRSELADTKEKGRPFVWGPEQEKSLQDLKTAFAKSDFLTHPDDSRPFILETDASDYAISGVLSQLVGLWLSEYDFSLTHRPGKLNGRADSLSRREDYKANTESSNFQRILDPSKVVDLQSLVADMDCITAPQPSIRKVHCCICDTDKRVDVMKHYHTSLAHLKYGSIIDLLLQRFWWPSMKKDLKDFIARCPECQLDRSSSGIHAPLPIRPVPPVALPFERWGIDFYGPMAETKSGNKYLITASIMQLDGSWPSRLRT